MAGDRLLGSGGYNRFVGGYQTEGDQLSIEPLASTKMACEETDSFRGCFKSIKRVVLPPNPPPMGDFRSRSSSSKSPIDGGCRGRFGLHR
ncbi:META domain-containing protein [Leptolyngbya sp. NK1-12]|uniref:META domain-containing protein n=1 Tax=Leptolyngbya sp. NK1-12 TaxID=2547451 RepID=UPI003B635A0D